MVINEEKGNLFELDNKYYLVQCASLDCVMGMGIASQFRIHFPRIAVECLFNIKKYNLSIPCVIFHNNNDKGVFTLFTKNRYFDLPTYDDLKSCLKQLANICKENNIKYLAMSRIGCNLDRLSWKTVKNMIINEFKDIDINIEIRTKN